MEQIATKNAATATEARPHTVLLSNRCYCGVLVADIKLSSVPALVPGDACVF